MTPSSTRHLINRQRRIAARGDRATTATLPRPLGDVAETDEVSDVEAAAGAAGAPGAAEPAELGGGPDLAPAPRTPRRSRSWPVLLAVLTVLLGGFAAWAGVRADDDRAGSGHNSALTDTARTSEVTGSVAQAVNQLFSYTWTDPAKSDTVAGRWLTGKAVSQYQSLMAAIRLQGPREKLVLSTTVTDCGVDVLDGDRAHLLVYADQTSVSTAAGAGSGASSDGAAMIAVDAVRVQGAWRIADLDTFGV